MTLYKGHACGATVPMLAQALQAAFEHQELCNRIALTTPFSHREIGEVLDVARRLGHGPAPMLRAIVAAAREGRPIRVVLAALDVERVQQLPTAEAMKRLLAPRPPAPRRPVILLPSPQAEEFKRRLETRRQQDLRRAQRKADERARRGRRARGANQRKARKEARSC